MQEDTAPTLRTQVCAITHLEPWLDAKEEEVGVPDAKEIPHGDLDGGLKCNREDDRGGNHQPGMGSTQADLEDPYTRSDANRLEYQPDPEGKPRGVVPLM